MIFAEHIVLARASAPEVAVAPRGRVDLEQFSVDAHAVRQGFRRWEDRRQKQRAYITLEAGIQAKVVSLKGAQ